MVIQHPPERHCSQALRAKECGLRRGQSNWAGMMANNQRQEADHD